MCSPCRKLLVAVIFVKSKKFFCPQSNSILGPLALQASMLPLDHWPQFLLNLTYYFCCYCDYCILLFACEKVCILYSELSTVCNVYAQIPLLTHLTCQAHAFWLCRACQTERIDTLDTTSSTGSTRNLVCCVICVKL